ncbi:GxxExxY protein [Erythrobacter sp. NE805]|uniref:GxxExxY protein n=1 Tax=Erythrobacter sp. NE805 TaxID=3389875 RepID=UPI00396B1564
MTTINDLSALVVGEAIRIHRALGPGLLESVYETVLFSSLGRQEIKIARQVPVDFEFEGLHFAGAFRIDLLIDDRLVVEVKSVETLSKAHLKQLLTYLRLTRRPLGLLLNFGEATMKDGIRRLVNNLDKET